MLNDKRTDKTNLLTVITNDSSLKNYKQTNWKA